MKLKKNQTLLEQVFTRKFFFKLLQQRSQKNSIQPEPIKSVNKKTLKSSTYKKQMVEK